MQITGERAMTDQGGFNPAWQRHVAAYVLTEPELGPGRVLDLGCGVGHSFDRLAPRETVGVDIEPAALEGQDRETHVADMRALPFGADSFASVVSMHSIEHVPDPERVLAEVARVLEPGGTAVFVTPNRLTFGRPDEIIDPYHYLEFDPRQLEALCRPHFADVTIVGLFGSERYLQLHAEERRTLDKILRLDPLRVRRAVPNRAKRRLYDLMLSRFRREPDPRALEITVDDLHLGHDDLDAALDLIAICRA